MRLRPTGLPKPKSYFFLSTRMAGPVPPSSESRHPITTSNSDLRGSRVFLKKLKLTTLAISTRFEVAAIDNLTGPFMNWLAPISDISVPAVLESEARDSFLRNRTYKSFYHSAGQCFDDICPTLWLSSTYRTG